MAKSLDIIDPKKELKEEDEEREEQSESPRRDDDFDMRPPRQEGGGVFYLVLGIIAIIVATGAALYILYKDYYPSKNVNNASQTPSVSASSSATTSASASVTATQSSTATAFKYTDEKIRVANGNGISGEGAKVQKELESKGFKIESVGNASRTYSQTIIYYKSGEDKLAEALKQAISSLYQATIEQSDSVTGSYDAVIALGSK